ncbi:MAG: circadian clock protein KaiB [Bacteroidetes bacterium]|nr:circadian clock protein KaiB [Bacteroidota bacterium]
MKERFHKYEMKLYTMSNSTDTVMAKQNLVNIFNVEIKCEYELEVVDLLKERNRAMVDNILTTPTLVASYGTKKRHIIGDFSNLVYELAEMKK